MFKKISLAIKTLCILTLLLGFIVLIYLFILIVTDYKPKSTENLDIFNNTINTLQVNEEFSIITADVGYGGIDQTTAFFENGVRKSGDVSKENFLNTLMHNIDNMLTHDPDFIFIQEIDTLAKRSNEVNQYDHLKEYLPAYASVYAPNYQAIWVPTPFSAPVGKLHSGQATFSKYNISSAARIALAQDGQWPEASIMAKRCIIETRLMTNNGKELVLYNVHFSDFDKDESLRLQQLETLKEKLEYESAKGNYVIAGGNWNFVLPGSQRILQKTTEPDAPDIKEIPRSFIPEGFSFVYAHETGSYRTSLMPYLEGYNAVYIIDGFLISDNVIKIDAEAVTTQFEYSDHNPIKMRFKLKR